VALRLYEASVQPRGAVPWREEKVEGHPAGWRESIMTKLLTVILLGVFSAAIVGCEASAKVGDTDSTDTTYKKTTTVDKSGDTTTRTETIQR
jgi:hypothetical protein